MPFVVVYILALAVSAAIDPRAPLAAQPARAAVQASVEAPNPAFRPVAGASLEDRRRAAVERGRADAGASHYWVAYAFDVRPGVAIDLEYPGGNSTSIDGFSIQTHARVETRNLAVFLLYERSARTPDRIEIYNLDRKRGYDAYPVYWIGRATGEESFAVMRGMLDGQPSAWVAERAVVAIAVNADPHAADVLEGVVTGSRIDRARSTAVLWLGITTDRLPFLADRARDDREGVELRKQAVMGIGLSASANAIPTLRSLFDAVTAHDVRDQIVVSAGIHGNDGEDAAAASNDDAVDFLISVANSEADRDLRRQALFWLSQKAGKRSLDALVDRATKDSDGEDELRKQAVFALSQRPKDEAVPALINLARTNRNPEVRKSAIFWLGQIDDERVLPFLREVLGR